MNGEIVRVSIQSADSDELNERSPLLATSSVESYNNTLHISYLVFLLFILLIGSIIGVYLILIEAGEWQNQTPTIYSLTPRRKWYNRPPQFQLPQLELPVSQILFSPILVQNEECLSPELQRKNRCSQFNAQLQLNQSDIAFNFIFATNGRVYEGRGWQNQTTFAKTRPNIVSLAFLEKNDIDSVPTLAQVESAKLLLDLGVMEGKVMSCHDILVWGEENRGFIEAARNIREALRNHCDNT